MPAKNSKSKKAKKSKKLPRAKGKKRVIPKKKAAKKKSAAKKIAKRPAKGRVRGRAGSAELVGYEPRGLGAVSGGQSGDTQGLSGVAETDSESVEELLEEGQSFEAEVVQGIESVPDADQGEVKTREVPEDDVPEEYRERD